VRRRDAWIEGQVDLDPARRAPGFFNRSHSTPEAWILLRDTLLGLSRRRRQQVKDLCNDIDSVNGPSVLLV
jgi:hypothetical protein